MTKLIPENYNGILDLAKKHKKNFVFRNIELTGEQLSGIIQTAAKSTFLILGLYECFVDSLEDFTLDSYIYY